MIKCLAQLNCASCLHEYALGISECYKPASSSISLSLTRTHTILAELPCSEAATEQFNILRIRLLSHWTVY